MARRWFEVFESFCVGDDDVVNFYLDGEKVCLEVSRSSEVSFLDIVLRSGWFLFNGCLGFFIGSF